MTFILAQFTIDIETPVNDSAFFARLHSWERHWITVLIVKKTALPQVPKLCQVVSTWSCNTLRLAFVSKNTNKDGRTGNPVVDGLIILFGIFDIIVDFVSIIRFAGVVPCAHVNTDSKTVR